MPISLRTLQSPTGVEITLDLLERGKSANGGWSGAQLRALGLRGFRSPDWKDQILGRSMSQAKAELFLSLKDEHLTNPQKHETTRLALEQKIGRKVDWDDPKEASKAFAEAKSVKVPKKKKRTRKKRIVKRSRGARHYNW